MKLYEIKEVYLNLLELELDGADIENYLKVVQGELDEKLQNIGLVYKTAVAEADAIKAEEKKLYERRKSLENKAENLKKWLYSEMTQLKIGKINKPNIVLSIAKNPHRLVVQDDLIPKQYKVSQIVISIDKAQIKDELKQGIKIKGAELVQDTSLRIK